MPGPGLHDILEDILPVADRFLLELFIRDEHELEAKWVLR